MKVDLLIVDYRIEGFQRYAVGICKQLRKFNPNMKIVGCCMKEFAAQEVEGFDDVLCAQIYGYDAEKILDKYKPKAILVFAHRFLDYMFTIEAHKKGVLVFNFQHAVYQTSATLSRLSLHSIPRLINENGEKIRIYSRCIYHICDKNAINTLYFIIQLVKHKSIFSIINDLHGKLCNADWSFVFGEYWINYYIKEYQEYASKYEIVGYPELEGPTKLVDRNDFVRKELPVVCYIAQSSVEDANLDRKIMVRFLLQLEKIIPHYNLVLKLHPRSDRSMYANLLDSKYNGKVMVWSENAFPIVNGYIGYESTMVGRALTITNNVLLVRLLEGRISPYEHNAKYICNYSDLLTDEIDKMLQKKESDLSEMQYFIAKNPKGALQQTAKLIENTMKWSENNENSCVSTR